MSYALHHGDCLDVLPSLEAESVHAIIADLPYGTTACAWDSVIPLDPLWAQFRRVLKERGAVVLFGAQPFTTALISSNLEWFKYQWVWEKDVGANFGAVRYRPFSVHEDVIVFYDSAPTYNPQMWDAGFVSNHRSNGSLEVSERSIYGEGSIERIPGGRDSTDRYPRSVIQFAKPKHNDSVNGSYHPTQKPVALLEYLVRTYTNEGETVLDCTMGSGTTGVACMNTARDFIGIELEREYYEIAQARIDKAYNAPRQLELL